MPLTSDFRENPFRPKQHTLQRFEHLQHALLATSIQHVSRMSDTEQDSSISYRIVAYKSSATQLCMDALLQSSLISRTPIMDTIVILFALDVRF
jgi:hypothetical protein